MWLSNPGVSESVNIEPTSLLSLTLANLSLILAQVNLFDNAKKTTISAAITVGYEKVLGGIEKMKMCAHTIVRMHIIYVRVRLI